MKQSRTQIRRDLIKGAAAAPIETITVNREQLACALCGDEKAVADDDRTIRRRKGRQRKDPAQENPTPSMAEVDRQTVLDALRDEKPDAVRALCEGLHDEPHIRQAPPHASAGEKPASAGGKSKANAGNTDAKKAA